MSRRTERNVGVIGLGIIGRRVAENLRRRGFSVFVWNRTPRPFPNFVGSPAEIALLADFIQLFVSDDDALLEMVEQLKPSLKAHHVVMAHCTIAPHSMRAAAEIVQRRGAQFLDAPFTGSKLAAEKGELVYYIGGEETALQRARPILEGSSKEIIEIGEIGQATLIKVATNMVTAATVQATAEALAFLDRLGVEAGKFAAAMQGNSSNSGTVAMKLPKMMAGDFETHFSVKHMLKDVEIASRLGRAYGLTLGATEAARSSLLEAMRQRHGDDDYSVLVRALLPEGSAMAPGAANEEGDHPTLGLEEETAEPETVAAESEPEAESAEIEAGPIGEGAVEREEETAGDGSVTERAAETTAPETETAVAGPEPGPARGFFSRMFGKSPDERSPDERSTDY